MHNNKEGDKIAFSLNGEEKQGTILKIYTKIGFDDHGKEFVVIALSDAELTIYESEITMLKKNLVIIN
jgi:hypothetical protein